MDRANVERALAWLRAGGILERAIVFGSFGLALHGARTFESVPDLDVVATPDDAIEIARRFIARRARVTSWNDVVDANNIDSIAWSGRFYVRIVVVVEPPLTVDVTYEGPLDIEAMRNDAVVIHGVTVASVAWIERQRALKAADAARRNT